MESHWCIYNVWNLHNMNVTFLNMDIRTYTLCCIHIIWKLELGWDYVDFMPCYYLFLIQYLYLCVDNIDCPTYMKTLHKVTCDFTLTPSHKKKVKYTGQIHQTFLPFSGIKFSICQSRHSQACKRTVPHMLAKISKVLIATINLVIWPSSGVIGN